MVWDDLKVGPRLGSLLARRLLVSGSWPSFVSGEALPALVSLMLAGPRVGLVIEGDLEAAQQSGDGHVVADEQDDGHELAVGKD